jgi:UDPglucose 6-dehydrogenase
VVITDPKALENAQVDLEGAKGHVRYVEDPYRRLQPAACAIAVMTEWDLYRELDYEKIYQAMRKPSLYF